MPLAPPVLPYTWTFSSSPSIVMVNYKELTFRLALMQTICVSLTSIDEWFVAVFEVDSMGDLGACPTAFVLMLVRRVPAAKKDRVNQGIRNSKPTF